MNPKADRIISNILVTLFILGGALSIIIGISSSGTDTIAYEAMGIALLSFANTISFRSKNV